MLSSLLLSIFHGYIILFLLVDVTRCTDNDPALDLTVSPTAGFSAENVELRCRVIQPNVYDNIYLTVRTDGVKPSGILLMVDTMANDCRINKEKYLYVHICDSTQIIVHVNHTLIDDNINRIDYSCSQGESSTINSFRILREQRIQFQPKYDDSSSSLKYTLSLVLFNCMMTRIITIIQEYFI